MKLIKTATITFIILTLGCKPTGYSLISSTINNNPERIEEILNTGIDIDYQDSENTTALLTAVEYSNPELVKLLISKGANLEISGSRYNITPLQAAISNRNIEIVEILLEAGAKLENGTPALHKAIYKKDIQIYNLLISYGASRDITDISDSTSLMAAASVGFYEVLDDLLAWGADINHIDDSGYTALIRAAQNSRYKVIERLLLEGVETDHQSPLGYSALKIAIEKNNLPMVTMLVEAGASLILGNQSAYEYAKDKNRTEILEYLTSLE